MSIGLCFWILMLLWLVFGGWMFWGNNLYIGGTVLLFVLLGLLGWKCFGPPIHE